LIRICWGAKCSAGIRTSNKAQIFFAWEHALWKKLLGSSQLLYLIDFTDEQVLISGSRDRKKS
jgi:hypothetical protein